MTLWLSGSDGVRLAADTSGPETAVPVLLLHGSGQTRHSWKAVARKVAASGRRAIAVDVRGHGDSDRAPDGKYGWTQLSADIVGMCGDLDRPPVIVGASLSGKAGLIAVGRPDTAPIAAGLVMVDTLPRTHPDGPRGMGGVLKQPPDGFDSPQAAAELIAASKGEQVAPDAGRRLERSLRQRADGRWHWHWDPAFFGVDQGLSMHQSVDRLEAAAVHVKVPTIVVRGGNSRMTDQAGVDALRALMPHVEDVIIPGASHMVVGDANDAFGDALLAFLDRHDFR